MPPLAALLRRLRAAAGLTQEELAERAGVSARTISDTERGLRTSIYKDTAQRLAAALQLDDDSRATFTSVARGDGPVDATHTTGAEIPPPPTRLIGRDSELSAVLEALLDDDVRLVTLTGPGGIGKTRLAVEAANAARPEFVDGAFFVSLAPVADPRLLASIVAHAVGAKVVTAPPLDAITEHLRGKQVLLVLDTFEHVLDAAPVVGELLSRSPGLTVLATSREALHLRGEHEVPIPTLDLASTAPALFVERAQAVKPGLALDPETVADICRRVDGLPLAIELAAARVKHLPVASLREHLEHRLDVLTGGARDLPSRQQAMRDTVAWSYELLEPDEQELFRALSVFAGGWTLESARAIAPGGDVLGGSSALVDKNLVVLGEDGRYGMLDVIREYAAEQRDASEERETFSRVHAKHYTALAEEAEPEFGGPDQEDWYRRIETEHDNMRAALRFAVGDMQGELAARLGGALWQFWRATDHFEEGRTWLRRSLALTSAGHARAKALWGAAWLAFHQTDYEEAGALSVEFLALTRRDGDPADTRNALTVRGMVAMAQRRYAEALKSFEEGLELCRPLVGSWLLATSHLNLATAVLHIGDAARAEKLFGEALSLYEELGDRRFMIRTRMHIAQATVMQGEDERARGMAVAVLRDSWELRDASAAAEALETLSAIDADARPLDAAFVAGVAERLRETLSSRAMPFDRALTERRLSEARAKVSEDAWRSAWDGGRATALDEAIERAL